MPPSSLRAFVSGLLDYAGLFPPAALPMAGALENYAGYRGHPMLGGFVIKVDQVTALPEGAWPLVLIGTAVPSRHSGRRVAEADVEAVAGELGDRLGQEVRITAVEVAAPEVPQGQLELYRQLDEGLQLFYETAELDALSQAGAGLKLRLGGTSADKFPTAGALAQRLAAWGQLEAPLKLTAGLHQPLPHYDPQLEVRHHGFLNVFTAAMLARRDRLEASALQPLLGLDRPESFQFTDEALEVAGHRLTTSEIAALRQQVTGFGSCSFDEPLEGLRSGGWL